MFGNDSLPSCVYKYGCKPPHENAAVCEDQFSRAHAYRKKLVEVERARREAVAVKMRELVPELEKMQAAADKITAEIEAMATVLAAKNAKARRKVVTKEEKAELAKLKAARKEAYAEIKARKTEAYEDESVKAELKKIDAEFNERHKAERKASGLYHGTYEVVDGAARKTRSAKTPPKFPRWTGDGKIGTQVQGGAGIDDLLSGENSRIKIEMLPKKSKRQEFVGRVKVASDENRKPIYAEVGGKWHRPLPPGSRVKWAYLVRRRVASSDEWSLQLTVSRAAGFEKTDRAASGMVAINPGWRQTNDGIRVACWIGDDGQDGEIIVPESERKRWETPEKLRSLRDEMTNGIKSVLVAWRDGADAPPWLAEQIGYLRRFDDPRKTAEREAYEALLAAWAVKTERPEWLTERIANAGQWKAAGKFAALTLHWRGNRFEGDDAIFEAMEAWRERDKHLWTWEAHQRKKAARWRRGIYRNLAASLRRKYRDCVMAKVSYKKMARLPAAESDETIIAAARYNQRIASPGELTAIIEQSGPHLRKLEAKNLTRTCHNCGHVEKFDAVKYIYHTCTACGAEWDQDENHCRNLLAAASGDVVAKAPGPLEPVAVA